MFYQGVVICRQNCYSVGMTKKYITRVYELGTDRLRMRAQFNGEYYYPTFITPLKNGVEATYTFNRTTKVKPTMTIQLPEPMLQLPEPIADVKIFVINGDVKIIARLKLTEEVINAITDFLYVPGLNTDWVSSSYITISCQFYDPSEIAEKLAEYFESLAMKVKRVIGNTNVKTFIDNGAVSEIIIPRNHQDGSGGGYMVIPGNAQVNYDDDEPPIFVEV